MKLPAIRLIKFENSKSRTEAAEDSILFFKNFPRKFFRGKNSFIFNLLTSNLPHETENRLLVESSSEFQFHYSKKMHPLAHVLERHPPSIFQHAGRTATLAVHKLALHPDLSHYFNGSQFVTRPFSRPLVIPEIWLIVCFLLASLGAGSSHQGRVLFEILARTMF